VGEDRFRKIFKRTAEACLKAKIAKDEVFAHRCLVDLRQRAQMLTYYAFPDIHWQKIRTTDEIDKPFLLVLLFWKSTGDRVAKSWARGCQPDRAAITVAPHWRHPCAVFRDDAATIG
jgi:hypothetical protein